MGTEFSGLMPLAFTVGFEGEGFLVAFLGILLFFVERLLFVE